jgi:glycosyltransferase involved in cell wall biosynthesis
VKNLSRFHVFLHKHMIDRNIAISESVRKECTERNIMNTAKIYNGIQFDKFHDFRKQDCLFGEEVKIVNVARITHRKKGQDVLVRAVKECELKGLNVTCSFVGGVYDYDKGSLAYLTELAGELGVQDRIRFLGNVNDVNRLLPEFDLFVLPSRYEGLGLVVLEAMAAGLPVISSNIDGPAELIRHGGNGYLFESENAADLADQIIRVAREQESLRQVVTNATEFVKGFDIAIMLERYAALYEELRS